MFSTKLQQMIIRLNLSSSQNIHGFQSTMTTTTTSTTTTCKSEIKTEKLPSSLEEEIDVVFTQDLIDHLERTSLVNFGTEKAVETLAEAVQFAEILFTVDTSGVQPLVSVLENEPLRLRPDIPVESDRSKILSNAIVVEEDYFVAPPGNIPLEKTTKIQNIKKVDE